MTAQNKPPKPENFSLGAQRMNMCRAVNKMGLMSRTQAEKCIRAGEVTLNGSVERDPQRWVTLGEDAIEWQGNREVSSVLCYGVMNKPKGVVTTRADEEGKATVYDALPQEARGLWVFPVGRLDKDSEGLLLFTNDGPWAEQFTGGSSHAVKRYRVKLDKPPAPEALVQFRSGMMLDEQLTLPCEVEHEHGVWILVGLREGRNRQIRRMFHSLGYSVKRLIRVGIGQLNLTDEFTSGAFRWLTEEEKQLLLE